MTTQIRVVSEVEFRETFTEVLKPLLGKYDYVVGPGRSGAVAAVYASHFLGIPFVPYKCKLPNKKVLIVDTAMMSGKTLRKASRYYDDAHYVYAYLEGPRVKFWYEGLSMVRGVGYEFPKSAKSKSLQKGSN